jgi:molybdopterin molybdotransferase
VVISTGGVSVGTHDLVRGIGAELGVRELFWRIRLRPGKPLAFGLWDGPAGTGCGPAGSGPASAVPDGRGANRTLVFGLPGNPVSTLVTFELFVRPALLALQGAANPRPEFRSARLAVAVPRQAERDEMIRVKLNPAGELVPVRGQQSHQIAVSAPAVGLARIPMGAGELPAGSEVAYLPLHQG